MNTLSICRLFVLVCALSVVSGCARAPSEPMVTTKHYNEEGILVAETVEDKETHLEKERVKLIGQVIAYATEMASPPDSPGNVSAEGEVAHAFFKDDLSEHVGKMIASIGSGYFDMEINKNAQMHQTIRGLTPYIVPFALNAVAGRLGVDHADAGCSQEIYVTNSNMSNAGGLDSGPGGEAPGGSSSGGSRGLSIGGCGNVQNAEDVLAGFQTQILGRNGQFNWKGNNPAFAENDDSDSAGF